jgi:hypothetical protein
LNPGRRGGKPATNRLSYGAAVVVPCIDILAEDKSIVFKENSDIAILVHIMYSE